MYIWGGESYIYYIICTYLLRDDIPYDWRQVLDDRFRTGWCLSVQNFRMLIDEFRSAKIYNFITLLYV